MTVPLTYERARALLARYVARLERDFGERLRAVALFGSVARGVGGPTSDLDLIVVHTLDRPEASDRVVRAGLDLRTFPEYAELVRAGYLPEPSEILLTVEELARHPWILLDVLDHGIILLDRNDALRQELEVIRRRLEAYGSRKVVLPDGTWYWDIKPDWKPGEVVEL